MIHVVKANGERVPYNEERIRNSLSAAGAGEKDIDFIVSEVNKELVDGITTRKIFNKVVSLLKRRSKKVTGKYNLKQAIFELGPSGYPFERFIGKLFERQGCRVQTGLFVRGLCIEHEIDVYATKEEEVHLVECKFHNSRGTISHIQVPLYCLSRFYDIRKQAKKEGIDSKHQGWIITNTRFSDDSIKFSNCSNLRLIAWNYPANGGLKELVNLWGLYPLTCLISLKKKEKQYLLEEGLILCQDILQRPELLEQMGLEPRKQSLVLKEINELIGN